MDQVSHLGHIITYNLDDRLDIIRAMKDLNRKANSVLYKFSAADPFVKCFLIRSYLYGWSLSSSSIRLIEVALNRLLRKVWNLPYKSHAGIVHCIYHTDTYCYILIYCMYIYDHFCSLFSCSISSYSSLLRSVFVILLNMFIHLV